MARFKIITSTILISIMVTSCGFLEHKTLSAQELSVSEPSTEFEATLTDEDFQSELPEEVVEEETAIEEVQENEIPQKEAIKEETPKKETSKKESPKEETPEKPTKEDSSEEESLEEVSKEKSPKAEASEEQTIEEETLEEVQTNKKTPKKEEIETKKIEYRKVNDIKYASASVNIRKGPSAEYDRLGVLSKGQKVTSIGITDNGWIVINYEGKEGYVSNNYLVDVKPEEPAIPEKAQEESSKKTKTSKKAKKQKEPDESQEVKNQEEANKSFEDKYADEVLQLVNAERSKRGLPNLTTTKKLREAADLRAVEIVTLFEHERPDGSSCFTVLDECGISYKAAGENIAYAYRSPEHVVSGWMNSKGHRENILRKYFGKMGVGIYLDKDGYIGWVQLFTD